MLLKTFNAKSQFESSLSIGYRLFEFYVCFFLSIESIVGQCVTLFQILDELLPSLAFELVFFHVFVSVRNRKK